MKRFLTVALTALCLIPACSEAHGPVPQKVVKEVVVKAEPAKAWALVKDFGAIKDWHPDVSGEVLETAKDAGDETETLRRKLTFRDGKTLVEKLREANDQQMKLDYRMIGGTVAVSNYRSVMQVAPGPGAGESTITWTARFYNKANELAADPGEDDAAANAAINQIYDAGLAGLKQSLER